MSFRTCSCLYRYCATAVRRHASSSSVSASSINQPGMDRISIQKPNASYTQNPIAVASTSATTTSVEPAINTSKCGSGKKDEEYEPEMVNVQNATTGEIMGPSGPEPTRYLNIKLYMKCTNFAINRIFILIINYINNKLYRYIYRSINKLNIHKLVFNVNFFTQCRTLTCFSNIGYLQSHACFVTS